MSNSANNDNKKDVKSCYDYAGPIRIKGAVPIWRINLEVGKKGIKARFLTGIRNENSRNP